MMFSVKIRGWQSVFGFLVLVAAFPLVNARADAVRNGNEMALHYTTATGTEKTDVQKAATGVNHTWRFLKIKQITQPTDTDRFVKLVTVEPSSDMKVILVTNLKLSVKLAQTLQAGDCVSARGRVKSVAVEDKNTIVVDPAVLEYKDKDKPAAGKELLKEVDPRAN
jgi:hypothetical protein